MVIEKILTERVELPNRNIGYKIRVLGDDNSREVRDFYVASNGFHLVDMVQKVLDNMDAGHLNFQVVSVSGPYQNFAITK